LARKPANGMMVALDTVDMFGSRISPSCDAHARRRSFFIALSRGLGCAAAVWWPVARAQQGPPRIGFLTPGVPARYEQAFWAEMARLGHVKDKTIVVEARSADGRFERLPELAAQLVASKVEVIVAFVTQATVAARDATKTIPIVMVGVADPVDAGLVANLARPGANVTGTSIVVAEVVGKQLELVRELMPHASRVAVLSNPANSIFQQQQLARSSEAAGRLAMQVHPVEARAPEDLERAFTAIRAQRVDAMLVLADPMLSGQAQTIARLAMQHRVVAVGATRVLVEAGIVASYGPHYVESFRRAASFVDRILRGAQPADLAVEQSSTFELVINSGAARRLGVVVPRSVAARVNEVID
jgi:putative tryptophan/tyrosine transport system substrate-binding protein